MFDQYSREIEYLRISITERCNLKCIYCRSENTETTARDELSKEDIERIVKQAAKLGIKKIRLTGGEPLIREDLEEIIFKISQNPEIKNISLTTNGQGLEARAKSLYQAGLNSINISIDSLDPERYFEITRGGNLKDTLNGLEEVIKIGFKPIKLNCVLLKGINENEIDGIIDLARKNPVDVRFIELMPIGEFGEDRSCYLSNKEVIKRYPALYKIPPRYSGQPAIDYTGDGFKGRVGFISPISHKFCHTCNRIRITSDGMLKPCLGSNEDFNLKNALLKSDEDLKIQIEKIIYNKPKGHCFENKFLSLREMSRIGG